MHAALTALGKPLEEARRVLSRLENRIVGELQAGSSIIYLDAEEEERALQTLERTAEELGMTLYQWSVTEKLQAEAAHCPACDEPRDVLLWFIDQVPADQNVLLVLKDFHEFLADDPSIQRLILDAHERFRNQLEPLRALVFLSPLRVQIEPLDKIMTDFHLGPPDEAEIHSLLEQHLPQISPFDRTELIWQARGLSYVEIERTILVHLARQAQGGADIQALGAEILMAKHQVVAKGELLEFYSNRVTFSDLGGLGTLKEMVTLAGLAIDFWGMLDLPRGWVLTGVPGSGKSLAAQAVAGELNLPLLRLDPGRLLDPFLGDTEHNTLAMIEVCEQLSPVVLWVDEIEKGFGTDAGAAGTLSRVYAILLNWLQERQAPVLVVATANDLENNALVEFFRPGRFDAVFWFNVPDDESRKKIWDVQLRKHRLDYFDPEQVAAFAKASSNATGAEIEAVILGVLTELASRRTSNDRPVDLFETVMGALDQAREQWFQNTQHGQASNAARENRAAMFGAVPVYR
jgi:hypothetical protein